MAGIKITVSLNKTKELHKRLSRGEVSNALDDVLTEVESMWIEDAHVITGFMQSRISHRVFGSVGRGEVFCDAEYAQYERERGAIHDFAARGTSMGPRLLKARMQELISG